jgi:hypothetical protein
LELQIEGKTEHIKQGSHICQLYNKTSEVVNVAASLIQTGLQNNEKCFYAGHSEVVAEIRGARRWTWTSAAPSSAGSWS